MMNKIVISAMFCVAMCVAFAGAETVADEVRSAVNLFDDARKAINNECTSNGNCYPINIIDNLCCAKKGILKQCCNMFAYISEAPRENFPQFLENSRPVNIFIVFVLGILTVVCVVLTMLLFIKLLTWICCSCCFREKSINYIVLPEAVTTSSMNLSKADKRQESTEAV